jgi:hypothetical protein
VERWLYELSHFSYTIIHIDGVLNKDADIVSRLFLVNAMTMNAMSEENIEWNDAQKLESFRSVHNALYGHKGLQATCRLLDLMDISWKNMKSDITRFISACSVCQKMSVKLGPVSFGTTVTTTPFEVVALDFVQLDEVLGYANILVIMDTFSRWCHLVPTKGTTALEVVESLLKYFAIFGVPSAIRSDNGAAFISALTKEMVDIFGSSNNYQLPHLHSANGLVERQIREVGKYLRAYVMECRLKNWVRAVPFLQMSLNSTVNRTTGFTPAQIIFGNRVDLRSALLKVNTNLQVRMPDGFSSEIDYAGYYDDLKVMLSKIEMLAGETQVKTVTARRARGKEVSDVFWRG